MRIVNHEAFMALPQGTVYARHSGGNFGEFEIKLENTGPNRWQFFIVAPANIELDDSGDYFETLKNATQPDGGTGMAFNNHYNEDPDNTDFVGKLNTEYEYAIFSDWDVQNMILLFQKFLPKSLS
jgi:hypothetical protein